MGTLDILFLITSVFAVGLVIWSYTKKGKKWLSDL